MRRRRVVGGVVVASMLGALVPITAAADTTTPDSYATAHVIPVCHSDNCAWTTAGNTSHGANTTGGAPIWTQTADEVESSTLTPFWAVRNPGGTSALGNGYATTSCSGTTHSGNGWGFCTSTVAGQNSPYGEADALQLGGATGWGTFISPAYGSAQGETCAWLEWQDNNGDILMSATASGDTSTQRQNAVTAPYLWQLAIGSANNLVFTDQNGNYTTLNLTASFVGIWNWICVGWDGNNTFTLHWPTGSTTNWVDPSPSTLTVTPTGIESEGTLSIFGLGTFYGSPTAGQSIYAVPSAGCPACTSGSTSPTCSQTGIISGAPKIQWCPSVPDCSGFDTGWNVGADIQWLGCVTEAALITLAKSLVNALIDVFVPDFVAIQTQWTTTEATLATHVPFNYVTGALSYIPTAFTGAHTTPTVSFPLPPPWSFTVNLTWSQIFGIMAPYRAIVLAFLYLAFGAAVVIHGRHALEN